MQLLHILFFEICNFCIFFKKTRQRMRDPLPFCLVFGVLLFVDKILWTQNLPPKISKKKSKKFLGGSPRADARGVKMLVRAG